MSSKTSETNTVVIVILCAVIAVAIYFVWNMHPRKRMLSQMGYGDADSTGNLADLSLQSPSQPTERYTMKFGETPSRNERIENVLGRIENTFNLQGVPQSVNVPEMVVGLGVGPGILGNMRNPSENIYLSPNTGIF